MFKTQAIPFIDLSKNAVQAEQVLEDYLHELSGLKDTKFWMARNPSSAIHAENLDYYATVVADAAEKLRALGIAPARDTDDRKRRSELNSLRAAFGSLAYLPNPSMTGEVATAPGLPAHVAPPSGGEAVAVFSLVEGAKFAGKFTLISGGKVTRTEGKPPKETFFSATSLGVATLEDVQHYGLLMDAFPNGVWVRAALKDEYAPAVCGVRRATAPRPELGKLDHAGFEASASRLQFFDLDKITPPDGFDLTDFDAVVELCLAYLPAACRDAPTLWTATSSYGLDGKISMRAFCLTDRALTPEQLKAWTPQIEGVDASMGSSIQAVYVHRVCKDEATGKPCADPYAGLRWRIRPGHYRYTTVLDSDLRVAPEKAKRAPRATGGERVARMKPSEVQKAPKGGSGRGGRDFLDALDLIGAAENGGHIHAPLGSAIGHYFLDVEPTLENAQKLYTILADLLNSLPARGPGEKQPEAYLQGLERQIEATRQKEEVGRKARAEAEDALGEVVDDEPTQSADAVSAQILSHVTAFFHQSDYQGAVEVKGLFYDGDVGIDDGDGEVLHPVTILKRQMTGATILELDRYAALVPWEGYAAPGYDAAKKAMRAKPNAQDIRAYQQAVALEALGVRQIMRQTNGSMMLAVTVATGKTTHAVAVVNDYVKPGPKGEGGSRSVAWLSCDHDLLKETMQKVPTAAIYMGPDAVDAPPGHCVRVKARRAYMKAGGTQEDYCHTVCKLKDLPLSADPQFDGGPGNVPTPQGLVYDFSDPTGLRPVYRCGYHAFAERAKGSRVWGFADSLGAMTRPIPRVAKQAGMIKPTRIVADEPDLDKLIQIGAVIVHEWDAELSKLDAVLDLKLGKAAMLRAGATAKRVDKERSREVARLDRSAARLTTKAERDLSGLNPSNAYRSKAQAPLRLLKRNAQALQREAQAMTRQGQRLDDEPDQLRRRAASLEENVATCRAKRDELAAFMGRVKQTFMMDSTDPGVKLTVERLRSILPETTLTPEQVRAFGVKPADTSIDQAKFDDLTARQGKPDPDVLAMTDHNATIRQAAELLEALRQLKLADAPASLVLDGWFFDVVKVSRWDGAKFEDVERLALRFKHKASFTEDWADTRLLMLDATAQDDLVKCVDPACHIVRLQAAESHVRTVVRMVPSATDDWASRAALVDAWAIRKVQGFGGDPGAVGIIGHKAMITAMKKLHDGEPPYLTSHWGKESGFNRMENVKLLATFGRPLRKAEDTVSDATALTGAPGQQVAEMVMESSRWVARGGDVFPAGRLEVPGDGLHRALHANTLDGGVIQALGRSRQVRRTAANPVQIEVFIDTTIPGVLVDDVMAYETFPEAVKADERDGLHTLVSETLAAGRVPVGGGASKVWRALAGWTEEGEAARKRWERERERAYDGQTLGAVLDAAEAQAKATAKAAAGVAVVSCEREGVKGLVVLTGSPALDWLTEAGFDGEVLTGKPRRDALR